MARPRLAIAIPSLNRARMLDAVLRAFQPTCEALSIPILVSDNGSSDETPEVCAHWASRWSGFHFRRHPETIPAGRSVMSAIEMSDAEYTWLSGDDDYLLPRGIHSVADWLSRRSPDAIVVRTIEVPNSDFVALELPLGPQLAALLGRAARGEGIREYSGAGEFFAEKHIILPAPSVIYPTDRTLATDYERYQETHHAHIGALFDALAVEQAKRGRIDVLELTDICSISLTVHHDRGKDQWSDIFRYLAEEGFPKWFSLLPPIYALHIHIAEAHHRHIFRAVLGPKADEEPSESTE
jgi:glycosyltransferase involved in cell wall biosynthesis